MKELLNVLKLEFKRPKTRYPVCENVSKNRTKNTWNEVHTILLVNINGIFKLLINTTYFSINNYIYYILLKKVLGL